MGDTEQITARRRKADGVNAVMAIVLTASITANLTLGWAQLSQARLVSKADLREAIEKAPYPWNTDKSIVMSHIHSQDIHEPDGVKRARIKDVVNSELSVILVELRNINERLSRMEKENKS